MTIEEARKEVRRRINHPTLRAHYDDRLVMLWGLTLERGPRIEFREWVDRHATADELLTACHAALRICGIDPGPGALPWPLPGPPKPAAKKYGPYVSRQRMEAIWRKRFRK